jgi:hypothetical protein
VYSNYALTNFESSRVYNQYSTATFGSTEEVREARKLLNPMDIPVPTLPHAVPCAWANSTLGNDTRQKNQLVKH